MNLESLNQMGEGNMLAFLDIKFTEVGNDYLVATMPVTAKVKQPMGLLHGGANVALAESIASCAAYCVAGKGSMVVGVEINANHLKAVRNGEVSAKATPVRLGSTLQVWQINITQGDQLVCSSRLTAMVKPIKA
ncbi:MULTISPECIES: hotdog fold thioesterase [unclassified Agarivorans]|uniref:hotdog fold thioesterase n=1 Tax=unclassified Agarivorans TaxID=2636026 RepID=UPI0026E34B89|nr:MULTISPECIES: hotdog fold thioesterase [unclassified Agarivorans]MDO6687817.1 hotdog fold thioesterase [Agarivorans sp. 3_MG-2023]MDO6717319.1 hotdog fold thioesterase [Agarivorans sp. 2_MG-2023]